MQIIKALIAADALVNSICRQTLRTSRSPKSGSLASWRRGSLWTDALFWQKIP
jgi:hypothetical protein